MKVRMKTAIAGTLGSQPWPPVGGFAEVPAEAAQQLIAGDLAEPADAPRKRRSRA